MSNVFPTWVYHAEEEAKIVQSDKAKELYKQGWCKCPTEAKAKAEAEAKAKAGK